MKQMELVRRAAGIGGMVLAVALTLTAPAAHADNFGAIFTSDVNHTVNVNQYDSFADIYLNGGGNGMGDKLHVGQYAYGITGTAGGPNEQLFTTVGCFTQTDEDDLVFFNLLSGAAPEGGPIGTGVSVVNNPQPGEFKLHVWQLSDMLSPVVNCPTTLAGLSDFSDKTDNFKVGNTGTVNPPPVPEPCSLALLATGALPLLRRRRQGKTATE
jgi:hypothetical protein